MKFFSRTTSAAVEPLEAVVSAGRRAGFHDWARGVLAAAFIIAAIYTLGRFREAVAWGVILAIVFWPWAGWLRRRLGGRHAETVGPLLIVAGLAAVFLVPLVAIGTEAAKEAHSAMDWVNSARSDGVPPPAILGELPFGSSQAVHWWSENLSDPAGEQRLMHRLQPERALHLAQSLGHEMANGTVLAAFSLLVLFFLLRAGPELEDRAKVLSDRLFGATGETVMTHIVGSVRGSMAGLVLVGLGEGLVIGISYVIAGAPQPLLLGLLTAIASMIPMLGGIAVAIAAVVLLAVGKTVGAIAVAVWGMLVLFLADHFIRPVLIGGSTKLPFVWVLLGILGGLESWGLIGLFVGPAVMAVVHLLWRMGSSRGMDKAATGQG
jgi:predicted PurR-regulated permease PerM